MLEESFVQYQHQQQPYTWYDLRRDGLRVTFPELDGHKYIDDSSVRVPHLALLTRAPSDGPGECAIVSGSGEVVAIGMKFADFSTKRSLFIVDRVARGDVHRFAHLCFPREVPATNCSIQLEPLTRRATSRGSLHSLCMPHLHNQVRSIRFAGATA